MTENKNILEKQIADDLSAVLKEAKEMGCTEVACFRHISLKNVETVVRALEEIQAYRTIGTVEGYECAIESSIENYNLMKEYKAKVQEYEAIGTIEEFKVLKEKSVAKKPITYTHTHRADCPNCRATVRGIDKPFGDYCSKCGTKIDWSE